MRVISILTFLLIASEGFAQILCPSQMVQEKDGRYYIQENGEKSRVNESVITVKLKDGLKIEKSKVKPLRSNKLGYIDLVVPHNMAFKDYAVQLAESGLFELVKYNTFASVCYAPNDEHVGNQWHLETINAFDAWNVTMGSPDVKVAVIDIFPNASHPDIYQGSDAYGNINWEDGHDYTGIFSSDHGLSVAGIISSKSNNVIGVAGIAGGNYGAGSCVLPFNVSAGGTYIDMSTVDDAIIEATDNGVKVINMSFRSGSTNHPDVESAIDYAYNHGVVLVAASGNDYNTNWIGYPASNQHVIAVGAVGKSLNRCSFSNCGTGLEIVAPGDSIYTTTANDYNYLSGTSFSAPQVAGVAALMFSVNPNLSPSIIANLLRTSCTQITGYSFDNSGWNAQVGHGLLNAKAAVQAAENTVTHISGPTVPCLLSEYYVTSWPVENTVEWSITSSGGSLSIEDVLQPYYNPEHDDNYCYVYKSATYAKGTLTAKLKIGNNVIKTLTKKIDTGAGFSGTWCQQGDSLSTLTSGSSYIIQGGKTVYLQSDDFLDATVSYTSTMPHIGGVVNNNGVLSFTPPIIYEPGLPLLESQTVNAIQPNNSIVITVVKDGTCEAYQFRFILRRTPAFVIEPLLNISNVGKDYTFSLHSNSDITDRRMDSRNKSLWQLEIISFETGKSVYKTDSNESFLSVNTLGWKSGMYIVTAIIDEKTYASKIYIK